MNYAPNKSPAVLAEEIKEMAMRSITGIASKAKPESLSFICTSLAPSIPAEADFEVIHLALLRFAIRAPQHFYESPLHDEN